MPVGIRKQFFAPEVYPDANDLPPEYADYPPAPVLLAERESRDSGKSRDSGDAKAKTNTKKTSGKETSKEVSGNVALPPGNRKPLVPPKPPAVPLDKGYPYPQRLLPGDTGAELYKAAGHNWFGTNMANVGGQRWHSGNDNIRDLNLHIPELVNGPIENFQDCVGCIPKYRVPEINWHGCVDCGNKHPGSYSPHTNPYRNSHGDSNAPNARL